MRNVKGIVALTAIGYFFIASHGVVASSVQTCEAAIQVSDFRPTSYYSDYLPSKINSGLAEASLTQQRKQLSDCKQQVANRNKQISQ